MTGLPAARADAVSPPATEKASGKKADIKITNSGGLQKDEIERMKRDAEAHAAEDKARRELVDLKNRADAMVIQTRKQLGSPFTGHTRSVNSVAISADRQTLASGSDEPTVRLWDVQTHKELVTPLAAHNGAVNSVAFSPDGRTLASASTDGTLRLWNRLLWRSLAELQDEVCSLAVSGLSKPEWDQYAGGVPYRNSCP